MIEPEVSRITPKPADKKKIWKIWEVAIILGVVTAAEFFVALQFPESWKDFKIFLVKSRVLSGILSRLIHLKSLSSKIKKKFT